MAPSSKNSSKRPHHVVDLTGSDDDHQPPAPKTPRKALTTAQANEYIQSLVSQYDDDDEEDDNDDGGGHELLNSTQAVDNSGTAYIQLGRIDSKIVGIQYYDGFASMGEAVLVRRDPTNQYDKNAIRVLNVQGTQIGHIPRKLAAKLAEYMDDKSLLVEGELSGEKGQYDCPIKLMLFGTSEPEARLLLEGRMKADKLPLTKQKREPKKKEFTPNQRKKLGMKSSQTASGEPQPPELTGDDQGPDLDDLMQSAQRFNSRGVAELAEQWGSPEDMLAELPKAEQPKILQAKLLPYQLQGLSWLKKMEEPCLPAKDSSDTIQLWQRSKAKKELFMNLATNFATNKAPELASGGILADDMGLGKTVQCIALIATSTPGPTLIVAPVSVMSNWAQQIERHVKTEHALKVLTYHGSNRKKDMKERDFKKFDVIITAYGTLSHEYMPSGSSDPPPFPRATGIYSTKWRRVILDEGHIIRNPSTKVAVAACSVPASSRWILSGTPIINNVKDLYSMLKFVGITGGLERLDIFNAIVTRPLTNGEANAEVLLQTVMRSMVLRRKKDMKFVDLRLPGLTEYIQRIPFRDDERQKYQALQSEAQGMLHKYQDRIARQTGKAAGEYQHLLEILLRLRQVCCHWRLCGENRITDLMEAIQTQKVVELTDENRVALQALLQLSVENSDECPVCLDDLHNPVITTCKHIFGLECIEKVIQEQHKCPMCRNPLPDVEELVRPTEDTRSSQDDYLDIDTKSSKTEALMEILRASRKNPESKVVIFSQWTSFLDIIQRQLDEAGFRYCRIDGSMRAASRDAAMTALEREPEIRIMLASLAVCSVGLNLVAADTVILADSWWAPAIEDQAVDRVHRLGQTRPTTVWRLVMEDSIEERVLDIQKEKRLLVGKAFREKEKKGKSADLRATRLGDLQQLLQ